MAVTGKTGADAIFQAVNHICHVIAKYNSKFRAVTAAAEVAGAITSSEATLIIAFIDGLNALCAALDNLAAYSGF